MRNLFAMSVIVWIRFMVPGYAVELSGEFLLSAPF
jgi:hypothetical protein